MTGMVFRAARAVSGAVVAVVMALSLLVASLLVAPAASAAVVVHPGDVIRIQYSNGARYGCTLNSVAQRGGALYGVTAGHCLAPIGGARPVAVYAADGRTLLSDLRDSGYTYEGDNTLGGALTDVAWFRLPGDAVNASVVRGGYVDLPFFGANHVVSQFAQRVHPNRAVVSRQPVTSVKQWDVVCKDGGRTSRTCGRVLNVNPDTGEIAVAILAWQGDSGAPVYTVNPDGSVNIIGIASGTAYGFLLAVDAAVPLPAGLH